MNATTRSFVVLVACLGLVGAASFARGQEGGPPVPKPTPEHQRLAKEVGTWDATIKTWEPGSTSEPSVSQGVEKVKMLHGGLWAKSEFEGKFGGMDFHGCGQTGYDTKKGKYVGTWVDSMSTEIMMMEGDYDPATRTLTMHSKGTGPSGKPYEAKTTSKFEGDDTRVFTMSMKSDDTKGEFAKMMEITYKRRAK
jgi:hypothetical protein